MSDREPYDCPKGAAGCSQRHGGCVGHNRAGNPCGAPVMNGTGDRPRCYYHLGRKPEDVRAEYEAERQAMVLLRQQERIRASRGLPTAVDILDELRRAFAETVAWKDAIATLLGDLEQLRYRAGTAGEQVRGEVVVWERALDRVAKIGADLLRLGIESRAAQLSAVQESAVVLAINGTISELGQLYGFDATATEVRSVLKRHLADAGSV